MNPLPLFAIYAFIATNDPHFDLGKEQQRKSPMELNLLHTAPLYAGTQLHWREMEVTKIIDFDPTNELDKNSATKSPLLFHTQSVCERYRVKQVYLWAIDNPQPFYPSNVIGSRCAVWVPDPDNGIQL